MSRELTVLLTLIVYALALLAIGFWAARRTRDIDSFFIGRRTLGPLVASISASASSSSAWTLLGVSGAAFVWGLPALWLFPATLLGFVVNWLWVAPRISPMARRLRAITVPEILADGAPEGTRLAILRSTVIIIAVSFLFYVASQFQAAGSAFSETFEIDRASAIMLGGLVVLIYTYTGGFWAVSVTDTLQGLMMAASAIVLPVGAFLAVGGIDGLIEAAMASGGSGGQPGEWMSHFGPASVGFVCGTLGIGLGYPGQPHVVNRLMALRDEGALRAGRVIAIGWAVIVYAGMILLGLSGRVLAVDLADGEQVFFSLANSMFHPIVAGMLVAAVLSAIMSTADSQLLVVASSISHDWRGGARWAAMRREDNERDRGLRLSRQIVLLLATLAVVIAIYAPASIFSRVLFAWHAVGSALGPVLIVILAGFRIRPRFVVAALWAGFGLTVVLHWLPDTPGDWLERLLPFAVAGAIALLGLSGRRGSEVLEVDPQLLKSPE